MASISKTPKSNWYFRFLFLTLAFSVPFYVLGAFLPVDGLPFGLPISFLMIFVPFSLALLHAKRAAPSGTKQLLRSIFDVKKAKTWALIAGLLALPLVSVLAFLTQTFVPNGLPENISFALYILPLMLFLYFIGAAIEEAAWTSTLTTPMTARLGPLIAGTIIGAFWGVWHIIPWSWAHPSWWIVGMLLLSILMRIFMVYLFEFGGRSLFVCVIFHTLINVCTGLFPNDGSHFNPWIYSVIFLILVGILAVLFGKRKGIFRNKRSSTSERFRN